MGSHQHETDYRPAGANYGMVVMMICCLALIAIFFIFPRRLDGYSIIPFLLLIACPLMHLFMHRGHGGH